MKKKIAILGSTGSIGETTLSIIKIKSKDFIIDTLMANSNFIKIKNQIKKYKPNNFVVNNYETFKKLNKVSNFKNTKIFNNYDRLLKNKKFDILICAIPGIDGLKPTLEFTKRSKKILIANKETIICGWELLNKIIKKNKIQMVPIDSEHFSVSELLKDGNHKNISEIYITASGGPFFKKNKLNNISPNQALKHPKWSMGKKISIDSATMINKLLEYYEAQKLFKNYKNKIKIIIHPQALTHAIVRYKNGLTKFLFHEPHMSIPIINAIYDNKNNIEDFKKLNSNFFLDNYNKMEFYKVTKKNFPPFKILNMKKIYKSTHIIINAANEILVDCFLRKKIEFKGIIMGLEQVLRHKNYKKYAIKNPNNLNNIYYVNSWAKEITKRLLKKK